MTPINTKPIFNTHTNSFKIRIISTYIDWSLPPITIPSTDWESSYLQFISSVPLSSNYSLNNNSDPPPNNPSSNTNSSTFVPSRSDPSSNTNFLTSDLPPINISANINYSTSVPLHNSSSSNTNSPNSVPDSQLINMSSLSPPSHSPHYSSDNTTTST